MLKYVGLINHQPIEGIFLLYDPLQGGAYLAKELMY